MALVIALVIAGCLAITMLIFVAIEPGTQPADVAIAYELAWLRGDYSALFDLSAKEMRDGLDRAAFVGAKRAGDLRITDMSAQPRVSARVIVDEVVAVSDAASVVTHRDGDDVRYRVVCEKRHGRWQVVGHHLVTEP